MFFIQKIQNATILFMEVEGDWNNVDLVFTLVLLQLKYIVLEDEEDMPSMQQKITLTHTNITVISLFIQLFYPMQSFNYSNYILPVLITLSPSTLLTSFSFIVP